MLDLTVIILTYNEEIHIERCICSLQPLAPKIFVVDSFSTDKTVEIAEGLGAKVFTNPFINQAIQFQWGLDHCSIKTEWVLRLDADETIDDELIRNINDFIDQDGKGCNGAVFNRKHIFLGKWIRFGGRYPLPMLRLFRYGTAHIEQRWMDEHIVLDEGKSILLKGGFEDNNLNSVSWFIDKHNKYATREVVDIYLKKLFPEADSEITKSTNLGIKLKRILKQELYLKLPYFVRPVLYFFYRYIVQLGFLDGARGFAYHFMQGFWYRCLVDLKCLELDRILAGLIDDDKKLKALEVYSGFDLSTRHGKTRDAV